MRLPPAVGDHLDRLMAEVFEPAFILVDAEHTIRQVGGAMERYGLEDVAVGDPSNRCLWFLEGVLPLDGDEPLVLPSVNFNEDVSTHIHVIPGADGTWVLLVDASGDAAGQQVLKQAYNQLDLLRRRHEQDREESERDGRDESDIAKALGALGGVLLERHSGGRFKLYGTRTRWLDDVFPVVDGWVDLGDSAFLADFVGQAETVWSHDAVDRLESGLWTETRRDGGEDHLEALALGGGGRPLLLLRRRTGEHDERQRMLQIARDGRLRFDRLVKETRNNEILVHCIVHDLNGPLTGIMGCLDLIGLQNLAPKADDLLNLARRQTMAQKGMIQGILDAFSAEVESLRHVERDPGLAPDLRQTAKAAVESFKPYAETNAIRLEFLAPPGGDSTWKVVGEESRLQRILANLIDNALRHSPTNSTVRLHLRREGPHVYCDVEDEGAGVPDAVAGSLFNKLTKSDDSGGAAGLGLYFCRITIERWGGEIGFRSGDAGGTVFWFRLDAADAVALSETRMAGLLDGARVLLVEDDEVNRELIRGILETAGVVVTEAADGESALLAATPELVDAVLLDLNLPKLSGADVASRLRSEGGVHCRPIIAITGDDRISESDDRTLFDDVMTKPFSSDRLRSVLATALLQASEDVTGTPACAEVEPVRIPSLDFERTLDRLGGDAELLRRILARFEARCRGVTAEFRNLISNNRDDEATRLAHSLKGTAANLGVLGVEQAASRMEQGLRDPEADVRTMIEDLGRSILELSASLRLLGVIEEDS